MYQPAIIVVLLGMAVALAIACSLGVAIMRDPFQRLHFSASVVSLSALLIVTSVWLDDSDFQARIKATLIAVILFLMNGVLTHATARAARIHQLGHWRLEPEEGRGVVGRADVAGAAEKR